MASLCQKCNLAYSIRSKESRFSGHSKKPCLLRCGHSVCESCISRIIKDSKGSFPCPTCQVASTLEGGEKAFPQNIYLTGFIMVSQETLLNQELNKLLPAGATRRPPSHSHMKRGGEDRKALKQCRECRINAATCCCPKCDCLMCGMCFNKIHALSNTLREHQAVQLKGLEEEAEEENGEMAHLLLEAETPRMCATHPDRPIEYHCEDDQLAICSRCVVLGEHKHHNISSIEEKNKAMFTDLEEGVQVAKKILKRLKAAEKDLEMELGKGRPDTSATVKEIQDYFLHLHGLLQTREIQLVEKVKEAAKCNHEALQAMKEEVKDEWKKLNQAVKVGRRILNKNDMMVNAEEVIQILIHAKKIPCVVQKMDKVPTIRWKPGSAIKTAPQECGEVQEVGAERVQLLSVSETLMQEDSEDEESLDEDKLETTSSASLTDTRTSISSNGEDVIVEEEREVLSDSSLSGVVSHGKGSPRLLRHTDLPLKPQLQGSLEEVTVTHIVNPSQFFVQPCHTMGKLQQLSQSLNQHCRAGGASKPLSLQPGDLVIAQYTRDHTWYRARVRRLVPAETETCVDVVYIDYGNSEILPLSSLRNMSNRFKRKPEFSYECRLQDIVPAGITDREVEKNKWSKKASKTFLKMTVNQQILMSVFKDVGGTLEVDLLIPPISDILNDRPVSIRDSLVFLEHAKFVSNYVQPKLLGGVQRRDYVSMHPKHIGDKFYAIVCSPNVPSKFFVQQLGENANYLARMSDQMQELYNSKKSELYAVYCPQKDMVCMAKHELDHTWLRAKVLRLLGGRRVEVLYVDFGYIEEVPYTSLRKLHDNFLRFEPQARMCRLACVAPSHGNTWPSKALTWWRDLTAFKQFAFHVVDVQGSELVVVVHPVDLKKEQVDLSTSLNALCVSEGYAVRIGDWSEVAATQMQSEDCDLPSAPLVLGKMAKPAPTSNRARRPRNVRKGRMAARLNQKLAINFQQQLQGFEEPEQTKLSPDVNIEVIVSSFMAPDNFHLQVATAGPDGLDGLMKDLQAACAKGMGPADGEKWQKEDFCAAEVDGMWYRCCITAVTEEGLYEVRLVDYGGQRSVTEDALCPLNPDLTKHRRFAFPCSLSGITAPARLPSGDWPSTSRDRFVAIIEKKRLYIKSEGEEEDGRVQLVDLLVEEEIPATALEPVTKKIFSLRQRLLDLGVALPLKADRSSPGQLPQLPAAVSYTPKTNTVTYKPHLLPAATTMDAIPTYVDDEGYIYLQLTSEEPIRTSLCSRLQETYAYSAYEEIQWREGYDCVALYTVDNVWARARILSLSGNTARVLFLEFGNVEDVSVEDLRVATEEILAVPLLTMLATLHTVQPNTEHGSWSLEGLEDLHELLVGKQCRVTIKDHRSQDLYSVRIRLEDGTDVAEAMSLLNHIILLHDMKKFEHHSNTIHTVLKVANPYPDLVLMPVGQYFPGIITNVDLPNVVYVQHQPQSLEGLEGEKLALAQTINRNLEGLLQLAASINHSAPQAPFFQHPPLPGQQCCAQFSLDKCWYRGLVVESVLKGKAFLVLYVDYGNSEVVTPDRLRVMPRQYQDLPPQAFRCRLHGLTPPGAVWSSAALDAMVSTLVNTPLSICITADSPEVVVQLFQTGATEGQLAYESLVQQGLVLIQEEETQPPSSPLSNSPGSVGPSSPFAAPRDASTPSSLHATPTPQINDMVPLGIGIPSQSPVTQPAPSPSCSSSASSGMSHASPSMSHASPSMSHASPSNQSWAAQVDAELSEGTLTPSSSLLEMTLDGSDLEVARITDGSSV